MRNSIFFLAVFLSLLFYSPEKHPQSASSSPTSTWKLVNSPVRSDIRYLFSLPGGKLIASGRELLLYDGKEWIISPLQPDLTAISLLYKIESDKIWVSGTTRLNYSRLFLFDFKTFKEIRHPLANQIGRIFFYKNQQGWLAGDRELAYYDGRNWEMIEYPFMQARSFIGIKGKSAALITTDKKLWIFDGNLWHQHLGEANFYSLTYIADQKFLAISENLIYLYDRGKWSIHSGIHFAKDINDVFILDESSIWVCGNSGLIANYKNKEWIVNSTGISENLYKIVMVDEENGWASGRNGNLFEYSKKNGTYIETDRPGFDLFKIVSHGSEIKDEYGVAIEDLNGDGLKDIYAVCIFEPNRLYINKTNRNKDPFEYRFRDEAVQRDVTGLMGDSATVSFSEIYLGVGLADIDNDGDQDLYLCDLFGTNELCLNDGEGNFRNVSRQKNRACEKKERTNAAIFGDVDNDGDLDLFIVNEEKTNRLYLNDGLGYFTEVTAEAGLTTDFGGTSASFGDIDNDGDIDLVVVNWSRPNLLYRNETRNGRIKFVKVPDQIENPSYSKSNGVVFGDIDNDSDLDLFITNRRLPNELYINDGSGNFENKTSQYLGIDTFFSYGATFGDFDNDGYLDLYLANIGANKFYKNIGGRRFEDRTIQFGARLAGYSTGTAAGDIDNDGDLDLYAANYVDESSYLYINRIDNQRYILLDIEGRVSNRDAAGTKVYFYESGFMDDQNHLRGFREIRSGTGYGSHDSKQVHFGTGSIEKFDIKVVFPGNKSVKRLYNISAGSQLRIIEDYSSAGGQGELITEVKSFIRNPESQIELFKAAMAILLLSISYIFGKKRYKWNMFMFLMHIVLLFSFILQIHFFLYREFILSTLLPLVSLIVFIIIIHLYYQKIIMARLAKAERQKTRDRIARDLHDDLATTLSSAIIYSGAVKTNIDRNIFPDKSIITKINNLLLEAAEAITDIVWTVSPNKDKLEDLVARLNVFVIEYSKASSIQPTIETNIQNGDHHLNEEIKRNIFLIIKEAMHNLAKHSGADELRFIIKEENHCLEISLTDNGNGFSESMPGYIPGNGVHNMKKRAADLGAELEINSKLNFGTQIILTLKMT